MSPAGARNHETGDVVRPMHRGFSVMADTIAVTGGTSAVGQATIRALVRAGHTVRALVRTRVGAAIVDQWGALPILGDLLDPAAVGALTKGATVVVHAAASVMQSLDATLHARVNVEGTRLLLEAAREQQVRRFIYVSTAAVTLPALTTIAPGHLPYAHTKAQGEDLVLQATSRAMPTLALRPALLWGELDGSNAESSLVSFGGGAQPLSVCHIDNFADAVVAALTRGTGGSAYFIADDDVSPSGQFFRAVATARGIPAAAHVVPTWFALVVAKLVGVWFRVTGRAQHTPFTVETVVTRAKPTVVSTEAAKRELGWIPLVQRAEGLDRLSGVHRAIRSA